MATPHQDIERVRFAVDGVDRAGRRHALIHRQIVYRFEMLEQYFYLWCVRTITLRLSRAYPKLRRSLGIPLGLITNSASPLTKL